MATLDKGSQYVFPPVNLYLLCGLFHSQIPPKQLQPKPYKTITYLPPSQPKHIKIFKLFTCPTFSTIRFLKASITPNSGIHPESKEKVSDGNSKRKCKGKQIIRTTTGYYNHKPLYYKEDTIYAYGE